MVEELAEGIWCVNGTLKMPGGVVLPVRSTLVRLPDGRLWMHSPVRLSEEDAAAIRALGEVGWLVAPSLYHHLFMGPAQRHFPEAKALGAPGLATKRADLRFDEVLEDGAPPAGWGGAFEQVLLAGMPALNEVLFFHAPSRTLIVTDLVFHVREHAGWPSSLLFWMTGVGHELKMSRVLRFATKDRAAAKASLTRAMRWDFDRLIMAHGEVIERGAKARLEAGCAWLLG